MSSSEERFAKAAATALAARAEVRAGAGDDAGALEDLEDARRMGGLFGSEPDWLSIVGGGICDATATQGAQGCLAVVAKGARRLALYRAWLARPTPTFDVRPAYRIAAYQILALLRNTDRSQIRDIVPFCDWVDLGAGDVPDLSGAPRRSDTQRTGLPTDVRDRAYMARALRRWTELANATQGLTDSAERIAQEAERMEDRTDFRLVPLTHLFEGYFFSPPFGLVRLNPRIMARRALTLAYADALLQHARTGAWPASCPMPDPLGDGTFHTRIEGGRFRIWSVGENGVDDGGLDRFEYRGSKRSCDDLVAVYPPLPRRYERRPPLSLGPPLGFTSPTQASRG